MNMGSMNFSFHPLANRYRDEDWKFDWEKEYVAGSDGNIFRNTFRDIKEAADTLPPTTSSSSMNAMMSAIFIT